MRGRSVSRDLTAKPSSSLGFTLRPSLTEVQSICKTRRLTEPCSAVPAGRRQYKLFRGPCIPPPHSEPEPRARIPRWPRQAGIEDAELWQSKNTARRACRPSKRRAFTASVNQAGHGHRTVQIQLGFDKYKHVQRPPSRGAHTSRHSPNMYTHHTASASSLLLAAQPVPSHPKNKYGSLGQNFGAPKPRSLSSTLHRPSHSLGFTG